MAHVDRFGVAALNDDRGHPVELGHFVSALEAIAVGAKGDQQPWRQGRTGAREAAKDGRVGMLVHGLLNGLVQARDGLVQGFEHAGQGEDQHSAGVMIAGSVVKALAVCMAAKRCSIFLALRLLCL